MLQDEVGGAVKWKSHFIERFFFYLPQLIQFWALFELFVEDTIYYLNRNSMLRAYPCLQIFYVVNEGSNLDVFGLVKDGD